MERDCEWERARQTQKPLGWQEGAGWIGEGADVRLNYVRLHVTLWNKISWGLSV